MQIKDLPIGAEIELEVKYNGQCVNFQSQVVDVIENSVLINPIIVDEKTLGFADSNQVNFIYISEDKVFVWNHIDVILIKYNGNMYHKADLSGDGVPYNRRNSYRMYIGEDMPLHINTSRGSSTINVLVKDVSETGVAFITEEDLSIGRVFRLKLKDNNRLINLSGVIVRREYLEHLGSFLYGCKFNEYNTVLGGYIARKQIELLKKKSEQITYSRNKTHRTRHVIKQKFDNS
ncbi:MAG TPA: flagellar brake protein [Clostridiales bacterium]|nr:flagellar brake protein [Clostridiales bacterium]